MFELALKFFTDFFRKIINRRNYKQFIIMLIVSFSIQSYFVISKLITLENQVRQIPELLEKSQNKLHTQVKNEMAGIYKDAKGVFTLYTATVGNDLSTIVDYSKASKTEQNLLKKLINKTASDILQEIQRKELEHRVIDTGGILKRTINGQRLESYFSTDCKFNRLTLWDNERK